MTLPPLDTIPDISDYNSKSSLHNQSVSKQSKLSLLASARAANSVSTFSQSSRASGTEKQGSVKTYPGLRPTSQSLKPLSTIETPEATTPSSMSSHVRRAIQTALDMEALDGKEQGKAQENSEITTSPQKSISPSRPAAPTPPRTRMLSSLSQPPKAQIPSKLALLAQAKADSNQLAKSLSSLAKPPPKNHLPPEHTEILMPIANGPSATTAITTSYQSLYSLADPSRPSMNPTPFVVPLQAPSHVAISPDKPKKSKLAMKIKKVQAMQQLPPAEEESLSMPVDPIFATTQTRRPHAQPSSFATLLVDGPKRQSTKAKGKQRADNVSLSPTRTSLKPKEVQNVVPRLAMSSGFSFDVPSPDDIIFNARKGTSLSQYKHRAPGPGPSKPSTSTKK